VKTISLKKVSAVAVASLGFGLLSVVPAQATANTTYTVYNKTVTSISLVKATTTPTANAVVHVNVGFSAGALSANGAADQVTGAMNKLVGVLTSYPAGKFAAVTSSLSVNGGADNTTGVVAPTTGSRTVIASAVGSVLTGSTTDTDAIFQLRTDDTTASGSAAVTATSTTGVASFKFTPTAAGTYVLKVWNDGPAVGAATVGNRSVDAGEAEQTISITVVAATGLSTSASIVRMGSVGLGVTQNSATTTLTNYSTTVDAVPRSGAKGTSAAPTNIGQVAVVLVNADGSAAGNLHTVTADISGSGLVLCNVTDTAAAGTVRSSIYTLTGTNNVVVCHISSDGTAGPGTVTISVTDSVSETKTVLGTETFTSFGSVAKLEVSTKIFTIGRAGLPMGAASTTRIATSEIGSATLDATTKTTTSGTATTPAFIVKATDSIGQAVTTTADPVIVSGNTTVVTGGTCVLDGGASTVSSSTNGVGFYNCNFNVSAAAASGAKSTLTIRVVDPAGDGTTYLTTTLDVTVGGSISTETIAFDKTAYAPGEGMTITRTAKDSAGNPVFDGAAAPAITFSKSVGGTAPGASIYVGGTRSSTSSAGVQSVFAPSVPGAFTAIATSGNTAGSALSAASSVTDANAGLLTQIDALNAKIVALNALIAKIMKKLGVK
jgi:hypothetical protein